MEQRAGQDTWNRVNKRKKVGGKVKLVSDRVETEKFYSQCDKKPLDCFEQEKEMLRHIFLKTILGLKN